jgi:hypothetical protein
LSWKANLKKNAGYSAFTIVVFNRLTRKVHDREERGNISPKLFKEIITNLMQSKMA